MALQVWLPLNGNVKNQGLSNITVTNNGATVNDNGKIGKCYSFATNQYIQFTNVPASSLSNCSVCFWIKIAANEGQWLLLSGQGQQYYLLAYRDASYQNGNFYSSANVGTSYKIYIDGVEGTAPIHDGNWHHYCASGINLSSWTQFYINRYQTTSNAYNFAGQVNDFRIYDHVLSAKEVKDISKGLILHYPLEGNPLGNLEFYDYIQSSGTQYINTGFIPDNTSGIKMEAYCTTSGSNYQVVGCRQDSGNSRWWINFSSTLELSWNTWEGTVNDYTNRWVVIEHNYLNSRLGKIDGVTKRTNYPTLSNITYPAYLFSSNNQGNVGSSYVGRIKYIQITKGNSIIHNYIPCSYNGTPGMWDSVEGKFYGNDGTGTFTLGNKINVNNFSSDCSGYKNDGTITGTLTLSNDTPRYNSSTTFTNDYYIKIEKRIINLNNPFTISLWVNFTGGSNEFAITGADLENNRSFNFGSNGTANNQFLIFTPPKGYFGIQMGKIKEGWSHYALVYDGISNKMYRDGQLLYNQTINNASYNVNNITENFLKIYGRPQSDLRVYATVLSDNDILELYNTSAYIYNSDRIASYKFIEGGEVLNITSQGTVISASYEEEDETPVTFGDNYINSKEFIEI